MTVPVEQADAPTTARSSQKPTWWTDSLETSWNKARASVLQDWNTLVVGEKQLEARIEEEAVAFGYGARDAYRKFQFWEGSLEARLRADWRETGREADCAWEAARDAVKHGWQRASKTTRAACDPPSKPT